MSRYHFKPGGIFDNAFKNEDQGFADPLFDEQRSKTVEHNDRFLTNEKSQKLLKNEE